MMKKSILNLGKALNKAEQKNVNGGFRPCFPATKQECTDAGYIMPYAWNNGICCRFL